MSPCASLLVARGSLGFDGGGTSAAALLGSCRGAKGNPDSPSSCTHHLQLCELPQGLQVLADTSAEQPCRHSREHSMVHAMRVAACAIADACRCKGYFGIGAVVTPDTWKADMQMPHDSAHYTATCTCHPMNIVIGQ